MADNLERELMMERELLERELRPRVCYLTKGARGYGFHLHGERSRGAQYIRRIEPGSPAELAGLRSGDRVLQVNGESVDGETHQQVVQRILAVEHRTRLLVVDRVTEEFLKFHGLPCTEEGAIEMGSLSPRSSVASSPQNSNTPPYSRQTSSSSRALSLTSESGNKSPSALERMSNGSPLYKAHARLASPVFLSPASPSELINELKTQPKIDPNMEPNFELITKPNIESNIEPNFEVTTEPKIEPNFELKIDPSFEPIMEPNIEPNFELITEPISDLSVDFSGSQTSTQEMLEEEEEEKEEDVVVAKDLRPRLCHMIVSEQGYGFNLHCDKTRVGQYIRSVDPDSPAEHAGLKPKDRLIEVNGRGIGGLRHAEVVALIRAGGAETCLLVVDPETDELFKTLGITPTSTHLKEDCVDGPIIESPEPDRPPTDSPASSSPVPDAPRISPPIINITLTDSPITNGSPKHLSHGSSSSYSTLSENSVELSSSNISNKVTDSDQNTQDEVRNTKRGAQSDLRPLDPFWESGLNLSLTAAEAKQKARAKKPNKRAPPMDWSKKQEIFSNF